MIHHYLQKGFSHEYLLNLGPVEKLLYKASIDLYFDELRTKFTMN
jgi:hypothetical protein